MQLHVTNLDLFSNVREHEVFYRRMTSLKERFPALVWMETGRGERKDGIGARKQCSENKQAIEANSCLLFPHFDILLNPSNKNTCALRDAWRGSWYNKNIFHLLSQHGGKGFGGSVYNVELWKVESCWRGEGGGEVDWKLRAIFSFKVLKNWTRQSDLEVTLRRKVF